MPWISDQEGDLCNLDSCETIELIPSEVRDGEEEKWTVLACRDRALVSGSSILYEGDEKGARALMSLILTKLHMVKR